jgi:hypothetical protein
MSLLELTSQRSASDNVEALLLCRQIHHEARLLPLQINVIECPAIMGSNTALTKSFLDSLKPFQRGAIRKMKLHLLASVPEAWSLRSILRSVADISNSNEKQGIAQDHCLSGYGTSYTRTRYDKPARTSGHGKSDLRELTIFITTRDLLLATTDSLIGLLHVLAVPPASNSWQQHTASVAHTASWISEGLIYLSSLRRLNITIEASTSVASDLISGEHMYFSDLVNSVLPLVAVDIRWKVRRDMPHPFIDGTGPDPLWFSDFMASNTG